MIERTTGRSSDQFNLRLPEGLRDLLRSAAVKNRRSMNAEIVYYLECALSDHAQTEKADATA